MISISMHLLLSLILCHSPIIIATGISHSSFFLICSLNNNIIVARQHEPNRAGELLSQYSARHAPTTLVPTAHHPLHQTFGRRPLPIIKPAAEVSLFG